MQPIFESDLAAGPRRRSPVQQPAPPKRLRPAEPPGGGVADAAPQAAGALPHLRAPALRQAVVLRRIAGILSQQLRIHVISDLQPDALVKSAFLGK